MLKRFLLLAVVARAMVPIGYMPDFDALRGGGWPIMLCGTGLAQDTDLRHGHSAGLHDHGGHSGNGENGEGSSGHQQPLCDFAMLAGLAADASGFAPIPPFWADGAPWIVVADSLVRGGLAVQGGAARAPPFLIDID